jgi:glycosyltransferase involved in cell wall biosynthesis
MTRRNLATDNVLIVIPALNEASNIQEVLTSLKLLDYRILVVNDGSVDTTAAIARDCGVAVLDLAINLGVGGALRAGFQYACRHGYEAVIQIDADGQHPVDHIDDLIFAANDLHADMVVGSRFVNDPATMQVNGVRRLTMRVLAWSASRATQSPITDSTSGFRLIRQPLLGKFSHLFASNYLGDTYEALIAAGRAGYVVREIAAPIRERSIGESSSSTLQSFLQTIKVFTVALLQLHTRI